MGARGRGRWGAGVQWVRCSVWEDGEVLEMEGGDDGCMTTFMYLMPLNRILKNDEDGKFCYMYFTKLKKKEFKSIF